MIHTETDRRDVARRGLERLKQRLLLDAPLFDDPAAYAAGVIDTIDALCADASGTEPRPTAAPPAPRPVERTRIVRIPPSPDAEQARSGGRARSPGDGVRPPL